jgi:hypothetical protein
MILKACGPRTIGAVPHFSVPVKKTLIERLYYIACNPTLPTYARYPSERYSTFIEFPRCRRVSVINLGIPNDGHTYAMKVRRAYRPQCEIAGVLQGRHENCQQQSDNRHYNKQLN